MKRGVVERDFDVSGVSGTGSVAEFCIADDGRMVIFWPKGHGYHDSLADAIRIHGHNGHTRFVMIDDPVDEVADVIHCIICHDPQLNCDHDACPACLVGVKV